MIGDQGPLLGAAYYPEYLPAGRRGGAVERDLDLMRAAGIRVIRVGESVWSTWEPRDGEFELEWLAPVLDAAAERGMSAILGTPTYAVPPWLQRAHPELRVRRADDRLVRWGARQEADFTSPVFLDYAERVIRAVLGRHGHHESLVAVQLDNEPGLHLIHNDGTVARFREWLRERFDSVDELNEAWGLAYWSHRIAEWDELWEPGGNTTPAYDLAWRRFQADLTTEFIGWQAGIARDLVAPGVELTTCIAYNRPAVDDVGLGSVLDVTSGNAYLLFQNGLDAGARSEHGAAIWYTTSPAGLFQQADRMRSSRQAGYLVTETAATSIAGSAFNLPPEDGQIEQVALALVARGARLVSYWHWHTLHSGAETYWGGILGHDLEPGRSYDAIAGIGRALATAGDALTGLEPETDIGVLFSRESRWLMQFHPPLAGAGGAGDPASYDRILARFAEAAFDAGLQSGTIAVEQLPSAAELLARFPALVVAGAIVLDDATAARLTEYAELGGRLVLGIRSGYGDELGRARAETAPGPFRAAAGARYREYANLTAPVPLASGAERLEDGAHAEAWADHLEPEGATVLAGYADRRLGRYAAITEQARGRGSVVYVGTLPDRGTLARVLGTTGRGSAAVFPELPGGLTAHSARNAAGERVWFLHNWSAEPAELRAAVPLRDLLEPGRPALGSVIALTARGVRVLMEDAL